MYSRQFWKFPLYVKMATIKYIMEKWNQKNIQKNLPLKEAYEYLTLRNGWFDASLRMIL